MRAILCSEDEPELEPVEVSFPIPDEEYGRILSELNGLGVGSIRDRDCHVDQILDAPPVLDMLEGQNVNLDELDFLARSLDRYTDGELAQFQTMASARGYTDMEDLINLSLCCETVTVVKDFSDLDRIGHEHYMNLHGGGASAEELRNLNGEGIARALLQSGEGQITPYGVVYENGFRLEPLYSGRSFPPYMDKQYAMELEIESPQEEIPAVLFLPQPERRLHRLLERAGISAPEEAEIISWHSELPDAVNMRLDLLHESIPEINRLCAVIEPLDDSRREKLEAAVEYAKPEYVSQMLLVAEHLDDFDFAPGVKSVEEYGRYMIERSGRYDYDPNLDDYYDYARYGADHICRQDGAFEEGGFIVWRGEQDLNELLDQETDRGWEA